MKKKSSHCLQGIRRKAEEIIYFTDCKKFEELNETEKSSLIHECISFFNSLAAEKNKYIRDVEIPF